MTRMPNPLLIIRTIKEAPFRPRLISFMRPPNEDPDGAETLSGAANKITVEVLSPS